jgi:hypothetical protein
MSATLPPPDATLARRLLAPVPWGRRLTVGRLRPPVGLLPSEVRGLTDLEMFLEPDDQWLPGVDHVALCDWVGRELGDADLASALRIATSTAPNYVEGCVRAWMLVRDRVAQARAVAAAPEAIA